MITEKLQQEREGYVEYAGDLIDGSEEWHAYRESGLGASEIGSAMGIPGAFKSAITLWAEKCGIHEPAPFDERGEERLYWGHASEDMIAQRFSENHPEYLIENTGTWRNIQRRWQIVNPDRLIMNKETNEISLIEIKTSESGYGWGGGEAPKYYVVQVRDQLSALGLRYGYLVVKIGNTEYREYRIPLDANKPIINLHSGYMYYERDFSESIIIACAEGFLKCVEQRVAPTIDGSVSAWATVQKLNPLREDGTRYEVPESVALELMDSRREHEAAESRFRRNKAQLLKDAGTKHRIYYKNKDGEDVLLARRDKAPRGNGFILKIVTR